MKKRFYVYNSWKEQMELLSTEEKATMLMNLFAYQNNEEVVLNTPMLKMCWASMKFLLEKDAITYQQKVDNMAKIGKRNNKISNDTVTTTNDTVTIKNDIVNNRLDNDNVNANVNVNVNENGDGDENDWIAMFRQGETPKTLFPKYPFSRTEITSSWMEYVK